MSCLPCSIERFSQHSTYICTVCLRCSWHCICTPRTEITNGTGCSVCGNTGSVVDTRNASGVAPCPRCRNPKMTQEPA